MISTYINQQVQQSPQVRWISGLWAFSDSCRFCSGSTGDRVGGIVKGLCHTAGILRGHQVLHHVADGSAHRKFVFRDAGAFIGCAIAGKDKLVRNYLGLALIPQAGVAIGLEAMGARTLGGETGNILETVILASSVLYELIGPACAKLSLYLSKSYSNKLEEIVEIPEEEGAEQKTELELLIQRIQAIQQELPKHDDPFYEDEKAFSEAAEEHYAMTGIPNPNLYRRKRGAF